MGKLPKRGQAGQATWVVRQSESFLTNLWERQTEERKKWFLIIWQNIYNLSECSFLAPFSYNSIFLFSGLRKKIGEHTVVIIDRNEGQSNRNKPQQKHTGFILSFIHHLNVTQSHVIWHIVTKTFSWVLFYYSHLFAFNPTYCLWQHCCYLSRYSWHTLSFGGLGCPLPCAL